MLYTFELKAIILTLKAQRFKEERHGGKYTISPRFGFSRICYNYVFTDSHPIDRITNVRLSTDIPVEIL